jgi:ketosteroid isomerase-like protein
VAFDVPPPYDSVCGLEAYRQSWAPFFEWLRQGDAVFELVEPDVVAGANVGFAHALIPATGCGSPSACARTVATGS